MLPESKIYSFLDDQNGYTLHIFEGQKLIQDLAIIHNLKGEGFHYFRDSVLSGTMLCNLLKPGETLGLFIDSQEPFFRLKLEISHTGQMRTLLLPEDFDNFPLKINGECRLTKAFQNGAAPYTSIIKIENTSLGQVVNQLLKESYQLEGEVAVSQSVDQSYFFFKLPTNAGGSSTSISSVQAQHNELLSSFFAKNLTDPNEIQTYFEKAGFNYLKGQEIIFKCNCSRERMVAGVASLSTTTSLDDIFLNDSSIETRCDYCKTYYQIERKEVEDKLDSEKIIH